MRLDGILGRLFPAECLACARAGAPLCSTCLAAAAAPQRFVAGGIPARALGTYSGTLRRGVLAMKRGRRDVADVLAGALFECFGTELSSDLVLVPVPTSPARRAKRGFDQGTLLACGLGARAGLPVLCALRSAAKEAQQGRGRAARLAARERFACAGPLLDDARAVLIDDVATTGATLRDCASALRRGGARSCSALVVARARAEAPFAGAARAFGERASS